MAIQRRPFSRLLRHAGETEDVFSTSTPGVLTGGSGNESLNTESSILVYFRVASMLKMLHLDKICIIEMLQIWGRIFRKSLYNQNAIMIKKKKKKSI